MDRFITLLLVIAPFSPLLADTGGPDQYGYIWKDSNEPDGPAYSWVDITSTGIAVSGLADDNTFGPIILSGFMPYYWYDVKKVWVGSNGYLAFSGGNIAANFPALPLAGGTDNFAAVLMADLTFTGAGNPAQCFVQDESSRLIVSWINVPFWSVTAPGWTGSNTFQVILDKQDSTITMQYQSVSGITTSNGPVIGIESTVGSIGLARSQSLMPTAGYAVRFYNPATPLLEVVDAAVDWVGEEGTGGTVLTVGGSLPLATRVINSGNQSLAPFTLTSTVIAPSGQTVLTETVTVDAMDPNGALEPELLQPFVPAEPGTYRHRIMLSGIPDELVAINNVMDREVVVYPVAADLINVDWAGATDDGAGLGWNGGDGGIAAYIIPPFVPCQITGTTVRIFSNIGSSFAMMVYDDDGAEGAPGTLLDSTVVTAATGGPGDHVYPLSSAIQVTAEGGYYVVWYMLGADVNIAVDDQPPFSLRCFEVLGGAWAEYRERTATDFHLGLQVQQPPFLDVGVVGLIGINDGQEVAAGTTVQALVSNFGNIPANDFPVNYSFNNGPVVTQNYTGTNIAPGNSGVITFTQPLAPPAGAIGSLCTWTSASADDHDGNDSMCVNISIPVGIQQWNLPALQLYPAPAMDFVRVQNLPAGPVRWAVVDAKGAQVASGVYHGGEHGLLLNVRQFAEGYYVLRVLSEQAVLHGRFAVVR